MLRRGKRWQQCAIQKKYAGLQEVVILVAGKFQTIRDQVGER